MDFPVTAPKAGTFRMELNPETRRQLETIYEKAGLTLTDAVALSFQQSIKVGGLPFPVPEDHADQERAEALSRLMLELETGVNSRKLYEEDDVWRMMEV